MWARLPDLLFIEQQAASFAVGSVSQKSPDFDQKPAVQNL